MGFRDQLVHRVAVFLVHPEALEFELDRAFVQNTHHDRFAIQRRDRRDSDVNLSSFEAQGDVAILRNVLQVPLHDFFHQFPRFL